MAWRLTSEPGNKCKQIKEKNNTIHITLEHDTGKIGAKMDIRRTRRRLVYLRLWKKMVLVLGQQRTRKFEVVSIGSYNFEKERVGIWLNVNLDKLVIQSLGRGDDLNQGVEREDTVEKLNNKSRVWRTVASFFLRTWWK